MPKSGKNYKKSAEKVSAKSAYMIEEAVELLKETSSVKFDATAEIHFNLNIDTKKPEHNIRGTVALPHGTGKKVRIAAVVSDDKVKAAKAAGAVAAGLEDLIEEFSKGKVDYDVIIATPDIMKNLSKVAKILGQKGVMPNPKSGTVTDNVEKTIKELMMGRIEYRNDKQGCLHTIFGKLSFKKEDLVDNLKAMIKTIREAKPSTVKGIYIKSMSISSTMGPGIKLDTNEILKSIS